ncbi:MAG: hypothetical protein A2V90_09260, partial [Gammaproteobacteria bacterium RBG_16_57_12]
ANYYEGPLWHGHEMLFGFSAAVIAGFLLTAVRNWTNIDTPHGTPLMLLSLLWLAGRVLPFFPGSLPHALIAGVDLAFLPAVGLAVAIPIIKARQRHNLQFIVIISVLTLANLLIHLQALGYTQTSARTGTQLAVYLIILLIMVIGGRVIPFFIERALGGAQSTRSQFVEVACLSTLILFMLAKVAAAPAAMLSVLALATALSHGLRLSGWYNPQLWRVPLLWILYLGYGWLVIGFILQALAEIGLLSASLAQHAFTTGAIGALTLGMMARVSLGHTGRAMQSARGINYAFGLVIAAAALRVLGPLILPSWYSQIITLAGIVWLLAFVIFVIIYAPILLRPRVDGQPG